MILNCDTPLGPHRIIAEPGCLRRAGELLNLRRRVLIVTDDGVPADYARTVAASCRDARIVTVPQGERSKCFETLQELLRQMLDFSLTRQDCVVAVGGGVVCDLAGFAASVYMRGIDCCTVPTTVLAQADAAVGGKTAIDFAGVKNLVGAFHFPPVVLIDTDLLRTLPRRHISAGLAEAVKIGLTCDGELFSLFETDDPLAHLSEIVAQSVRLKRDVVSRDASDQGERRVLNFGHTIGHAIEAARPDLLHGECVALGMLPMCAPAVRRRLEAVLHRLGLPTCLSLPAEALAQTIAHDKKAENDAVRAVLVPEAGTYEIRMLTVGDLLRRLETIQGGAEKP
jgi:3-dehydroquinate synthase